MICIIGKNEIQGHGISQVHKLYSSKILIKCGKHNIYLPLVVLK